MKKILITLLIFLATIIPSLIFPQVGIGPAPYCMPNYIMQPCNQFGPSNSPGNSVNDFINSFNTTGAITNIVNNNSGCNAQNLSGTKNYRFWGCQHYLKVNPGQVITCNFQSGNTFSQGFALFVDWNNNNVFNLPAERLIGTGVPPAGTFISGNFTVPLTQAPGAYRLRVRCVYSSSGNFIDPCNTYTYGECEDYMLYVGINPPGTGTVTLTSNSPVCVGQMININTTITGGSGNPATYTYTWAGPNGFTSNQMNPSFTATSVAMSGIYTLNIAPGNGCNTTATIQIWVNPNPSTSITNNGPLCQGSNAIFLNTILGSGVTTYTWAGPNGFTSNVVSPTIPSAQPSNTGIYNFTITNTFTNGGICSATSNSSLAIVPVAQVSVIPSYTQCQGTNISLNANVLGASTFTWTGPNYNSNLQNPILSSATPANSGDYSVTATFTSPSTTLVCSSTAVSNVSVVPMNPVSITPPQNICQNTNVSITATAAGNPTYVWAATNGFTGALPSYTFNAQPNTTGTYSVAAVFSIGSVSCTTFNSTNISVVPVNSVTVVPLLNVCENDNAALTATAQGAISYTWTGPNNFNVVQPITYFQNLNPSWNGNYIVTAAFVNGNLTCYNTNTTTLIVNPKVNFTLTPYNQLCYNSTYNVSGPLGGSSYTWTGPGYNSNTQNLFIPNVNLINVGTYSLTVDLNGCKTYGSTVLQVINPIVWQNAPSNKTICKGDSFTITAQAGNGSGNYAYNWIPAVGLTSANGSIQTGTGLGTMIYNVTVYDVSCPQYTLNHTFTLNVNHAPIPNLQVNANKCEPFCAIYNSKVKDAGFVNYVFNKGRVYPGDSVNICLPAGNYTLETVSTGTNGCRETFKYPDIINVYPTPVANFIWDPQDPNTVSKSKVTFYPSPLNNNYSYYWEFNAADTSNEYTPVRIYDVQGKFPITMVATTEYGCKATITKILEVKEEFLLYIPNTFTPNGDGENDVFKPKGSGIKAYNLVVYDRWGQQIFVTTDIARGWDGTFKGNECQNGVYVYAMIAINNDNAKFEKVGHITLLK
jgi:gliding motility-associated-like protein